MIEIKIHDKNFAHVFLFGNGDLKIKSNNITWYRGGQERKICFFTDVYLSEINNPFLSKGKINVAWLLEPPSIVPQNYNWIKDNYSLFDYVLTYDKKLIEIDKRFVFYPHGGCWIDPKDFKIYNKIKNISMIASNKNVSEGHKLRHMVVDNFNKDIDLVCGRGYKTIDYKLYALEEYKYSIVIENGQYDYYFTEKLIDCFVTGSIPIYWGCNLKKGFDERGILYFNNLNELAAIINKIKYGEIKYENMIESIKTNFELAKNYTITEDWIYENFLKVKGLIG